MTRTWIGGGGLAEANDRAVRGVSSAVWWERRPAPASPAAYRR